MRRAEVYRFGLTNFRVVNAFLENAEGKLWIPRRTAEKKLIPLGLDTSMGGHVKSGETYEEAFARELQEELGLELMNVNWNEIGYLSPHMDGVTAFMKVYRIEMDSTPPYNRHDFIEAFWLTPKEIRKKLNEGDCGKDDLSRLLDRFYGD
ncbi:MAG: NUDIX domain-containing protein [Deltaproteobacteria bacterium]|nr:NUDIX domain-containing protein [Deltaproteobacteria bacterium]